MSAIRPFKEWPSSLPKCNPISTCSLWLGHFGELFLAHKEEMSMGLSPSLCWWDFFWFLLNGRLFKSTMLSSKVTFFLIGPGPVRYASLGQTDGLPSPWFLLLKKKKAKLFFNWSIVDLQCCVSFRCTEKWFSYTYTHINFLVLFYFSLYYFNIKKTTMLWHISSLIPGHAWNEKMKTTIWGLLWRSSG